MAEREEKQCLRLERLLNALTSVVVAGRQLLSYGNKNFFLEPTYNMQYITLVQLRGF